MSPKQFFRKMGELSWIASNLKHPLVKRLLETLALAKAAQKDTEGNSSANAFTGEYDDLDRVFRQLGIIEKGYVVDIAASDGYSQSPTLGFFSRKGWSGLAVEMDAGFFSKLAFIYASFPNARLARNRVTPGNIATLLHSFEVPHEYELLNLDIDSYDLFVIEEMLKAGYRPKVISMEVNEKIPPPIFFTVNFDNDHYWQVDHFFGCSIEAACSVVKPFGYILESMGYNNALFIRSDLAQDQFADLSAQDAYNQGYRNKVDRKELFPWNADMEPVLELNQTDAISFLHHYFKKYSGKYTLR